ncbi:hypothetical protein LTR85_006266 [Meristemomyces frigidus]|nr:hypothetical protein LTR85_006266 [Meristemomyces frigidus]
MASILWGLRGFTYVIDCGINAGSRPSGEHANARFATPTDYSPLYTLHDRLLHQIPTSALVILRTPVLLPTGSREYYDGDDTDSMHGYLKRLDVPLAKWRLIACNDADAWCRTFPDFCGLQGSTDYEPAQTGDGDWLWEDLF